MADEIKIKDPKQNGKATWVPFTVSGRAVDPVARVSGTLTVTSSGATIEGIPIAFHPRRGGGHRFYHWAIVFTETDTIKLPDRTACSVTVTGWATNGSRVGDDTVAFEVQRRPTRKKENGQPLDLKNVGIYSHGDGDDISAQKDDFTAYGDLVEHNVLSVTMNNVSCNYFFDDPDVLRFWYANFPPLGVGVYTLQVIDSANHSDGRTGLEVT
jgi:hypothetical protein